jgi:hypothetical protein
MREAISSRLTVIFVDILSFDVRSMSAAKVLPISQEQSKQDSGCRQAALHERKRSSLSTQES